MIVSNISRVSIPSSYKFRGSIFFLSSCIIVLFVIVPAWSQITEQNVAATTTPQPAKFLYVAGGYELGVNASTGALTYLRGVTPGVETTDPTYHYSYYAGRSSESSGYRPVIYANPINQANGELSSVPGSPFATDPSDLYSTVSADTKGEFLFLSEEDEYYNLHLSVYRINRTTGALQRTDRVFVGNENITCSCPATVVTDPSEKYVYFGYDGNNAPNRISAYALDATNGTLREVPGSPFSSPPIAMGWTPGMVTIGRFLYAFSDQAIAGFAINQETGALSEISGSPFNNPLGFSGTIDAVHNLLFTTNANNNCTQGNVITTFRINLTSGKLTRLAASGAGLHCPATIVADPSGKFVYVADLKYEPSCAFDQCVGATSSFAINPTTGKLQVVTKEIPYPGDPYDNGFPLAVAY